MNGLNSISQIENNMFQSTVIIPILLQWNLVKGQVFVCFCFLVYINDLNQALKLCKVNDFADINLL